MFDKWKTTVAGLVIGLIVGWGAWSYKQQSLQHDISSPITQTPITQTPITQIPTTPNAQVPTTQVPTGLEFAQVPNATAHLIGKPLPAWSFPANAWANTESPVTLDRLKGRVTLVEVFRINCSHCNEAAPFMEALQKNYGDKGLKIVGIQSPLQRNPDENDWTKVQQVVKGIWQATYPFGFDAKSQYLLKLYNGQTEQMRWPTVLLLDRNGVVVYGHTGYREATSMRLYAEIQRQLAKK